MHSILVIDDDPQIIKLLTRILETAGYDTISASGAELGIRAFKEQNPDLTILDLVMPEKEGLETIIELKRIDPGVNIIAISGGGRADPYAYLPMAKNLGAKETLAKPIDKDELLEKVRSVLSDN